MDLHVKISGRAAGLDESSGHYLIDARIDPESEDGAAVVLTVTRVESRVVRLFNRGDVIEQSVSAMRDLGDDASAARSVHVVRVLDRAVEKLKLDDPQWVEPESDAIDSQEVLW